MNEERKEKIFKSWYLNTKNNMELKKLLAKGGDVFLFDAEMGFIGLATVIQEE